MAALKWCHIACIAVLFAGAHVVCASQTEKIEEISYNSISMRFDSVTVMQWTEDKNDLNRTAEDNFPMAIAESATSYCQDSMGADSICKIGTSGTPSNAFTEIDVKIKTGYPKDENLDVQIVFYLSIEDQPKEAHVDQYALTLSVLEALLKANQANISNAVGKEVMFIGEERVGTPLDGTLNTIMIPLAIGVLVLLILITCILTCREKKIDKAAGFAAGKKRTELPAEDAHGEGVVLTAMNKGSSGAKPQQQTNNKTVSPVEVDDEQGPRGCREPRKKKCCSSSKAEKPDYIDKDSAVSVTKHISVNPVLAQSDTSNSSHSTKLPPLNPISKPTLRRGKSRHIEMPPSYDAVAAVITQDTLDNFLDDSDAGSYSSNPGYIDDDYQQKNSRKRAADKEALIKQSGRLPPLDKIPHSS